MSMQSVPSGSHCPWKPLTSRIEAFASTNVMPTLPDNNSNTLSLQLPNNYPTKLVESFVTGSDSKTIVETIFIVIASMLAAALFGMLFYWSYTTDTTLFITILSAITMLYGLMNVIYISVNANSYGKYTFQTFLGAGILMTIMNFILVGYFGYKAQTRLSAGAGGDRYAAQYQPAAPQY